MQCAICGAEITGSRVSAYPYGDVCCKRCNEMVVIPSRVRQTRLGRPLSREEMDAIIRTAGIRRSEE